MFLRTPTSVRNRKAMDFDARLNTDDEVDEALEETFPASDPPANTVETGVRVEDESSNAPEFAVRDHREASRFEVVKDGQVAFLQYERRPDAFVFSHTEVPESLRGRGIANQLVKVGLQSARAEGLPIVVRCPFVRAYLQKQSRSSGTQKGQ
jgi:predicted GNAT family acetyltransferase